MSTESFRFGFVIVQDCRSVRPSPKHSAMIKRNDPENLHFPPQFNVSLEALAGSPPSSHQMDSVVTWSAKDADGSSSSSPGLPDEALAASGGQTVRRDSDSLSSKTLVDEELPTESSERVEGIEERAVIADLGATSESQLAGSSSSSLFKMSSSSQFHLLDEAVDEMTQFARHIRRVGSGISAVDGAGGLDGGGGGGGGCGGLGGGGLGGVIESVSTDEGSAKIVEDRLRETLADFVAVVETEEEIGKVVHEGE